ncbi:MAG: SDR family oxidoreductase [Actinobacteria bacterium]|nr:SDR family oxidoreductase [Actinomycetota bacterium]
MGDLSGASALVTGGGSGIGLATAALLATDGAHVTICGRTEDKLRAAVEQIGSGAATGTDVRYAVADVTLEEQIATAVAGATEATGKLDICFANAGGSFHIGSVVDADAEAVSKTIELNLMGTFLTLKHAAASMAASGGGSIVGMSSGAGHFPHRFLWAYGAAKAGVEMLCKYAAEELADRNIRINCVQPGIIDDELMSFITAGGALLDDYREQTPIGRLGTVEDVAQAVRFLAGPESGWITGECLAIDGGHHLRRGANYQLLLEG